MMKMLKLRDLVAQGQELAPAAKAADIEYVLGERLGLTPSEFAMKQDLELTPDQEKQAKKDLKKLARGVSPQYILGFAWFYGYKIRVQRGVLIPRYDTEGLVKLALDHLESGQKVLDMGTGSGCLTVALAKEAAKQGKQNLTWYASDITDQALRASEENFLDYDLDVYVRKANVLIGLEKFDLIVSNPPYIKYSEKKYMDDNVLKNEPEEALFGGEDGLDFYRTFVKQVREHLTSHGQFCLEFGFQQRSALAELLQTALPDFELEFVKDLSGKDRFVYGRWQK
ncbi:MAG: peptide chain release factor N(5)-glutamine methyltransferase [Lactobacillus sp.]|jgi:release factor glutamine methyltransferase|nr:peptide chain release factor N(5)-glutamine methyltransferase [Lactobacillus sp.]